MKIKIVTIVILLILPFLSLSHLFAATNRNTNNIKIIALQNCSACHGIDGNSHNAQWPNIAGLNKDYIQKQLEDFKSGARENEEMELVVKSLSSSNEISALATFFSKQKRRLLDNALILKEPNSLVDLKLGKEIFMGNRIDYGIPGCLACHGERGQGSIGKSSTGKKNVIYPRITGQYPEYSVKQLKLFRALKRTNDSPPMMRNIAFMMDDEDIESVVAYIATLDEAKY